MLKYTISKVLLLWIFQIISANLVVSESLKPFQIVQKSNSTRPRQIHSMRVLTKKFEPFMYQDENGLFYDGIEYKLIKTIAEKEQLTKPVEFYNQEDVTTDGQCHFRYEFGMKNENFTRIFLFWNPFTLLDMFFFSQKIWYICGWFDSRFDITKIVRHFKTILTGRFDMVCAKIKESSTDIECVLGGNTWMLYTDNIWCGLPNRIDLLHYDSVWHEIQKSEPARLALLYDSHRVASHYWNESTFSTATHGVAIFLRIYSIYVICLLANIFFLSYTIHATSFAMANINCCRNGWKWISPVWLIWSPFVDNVWWTGTLKSSKDSSANIQNMIFLLFYSTKNLKPTYFSYARVLIVVWNIWKVMIIRIWPSVAHVNIFWTVAFIRQRKCSVLIAMKLSRHINHGFWCEKIFHSNRESMKSFGMHSKEDCLLNGAEKVRDSGNVWSNMNDFLRYHCKYRLVRFYFFVDVVRFWQHWHYFLNILFLKKCHKRIDRVFGCIWSNFSMENDIIWQIYPKNWWSWRRSRRNLTQKWMRLNVQHPLDDISGPACEHQAR